MSVPFRRGKDFIEAAKLVQQQFDAGGIVAYPTETVYGLAAALSNAGLDALNGLKHRDQTKPTMLLISSLEMLNAWGFEMSGAAESMAHAYWPGPLSLVLPNSDPRIPARLRGPSGGVGVRWTGHPGAAALVKALGMPLLSTSANLSGQPAAVSAGDVIDHFPEAVDSRLLLVLDGGEATHSIPSSVVDCTGPAKLLREGAISRVELRQYLQE